MRLEFAERTVNFVTAGPSVSGPPAWSDPRICAQQHSGSGKQDKTDAASLLSRALAVLEPEVEASHPTLLTCRENLAAIHGDGAA